MQLAGFGRRVRIVCSIKEMQGRGTRQAEPEIFAKLKMMCGLPLALHVGDVPGGEGGEGDLGEDKMDLGEC